MSDTNDMELLGRYARLGSEEAFAALVSRHVNLVYSVALRQTGDAAMAEEITQAVFVILARKANSLGEKTILAGWLCRTARNVAMNALTIQRRRQRREQEAYMQSLLNGGSDAPSQLSESETWRQIAPLLDAALGRLGGKDHDAIVLRFFENRNLQQVGAALGVSEDAAKKRVSRALDKLRQFFLKRGVDSTTATIGETISANSIQIAPTALAKTATAVALTKGAIATTSTLTLIQGALKIMAWTKAKTAIVAGAIMLFAAGTTTVIVVKTHTAINQRDSMAVQTGAMKESFFPAVMKFAKDHQDEIPRSMADLKPYLPAGATGMNDEQWQISASGKLAPLLTRGDVILLEQKNVPPGKQRIIVYTDGHVEWK